MGHNPEMTGCSISEECRQVLGQVQLAMKGGYIVQKFKHSTEAVVKRLQNGTVKDKDVSLVVNYLYQEGSLIIDSDSGDTQENKEAMIKNQTAKKTELPSAPYSSPDYVLSTSSKTTAHPAQGKGADEDVFVVIHHEGQPKCDEAGVANRLGAMGGNVLTGHSSSNLVPSVVPQGMFNSVNDLSSQGHSSQLPPVYDTPGTSVLQSLLEPARPEERPKGDHIRIGEVLTSLNQDVLTRNSGSNAVTHNIYPSTNNLGSDSFPSTRTPPPLYNVAVSSSAFPRGASVSSFPGQGNGPVDLPVSLSDFTSRIVTDAMNDTPTTQTNTMTSGQCPVQQAGNSNIAGVWDSSRVTNVTMPDSATPTRANAGDSGNGNEAEVGMDYNDVTGDSASVRDKVDRSNLFTCTICSEEFKFQSHLIFHMTFHTQNDTTSKKRLQCSVCQKVLKDEVSYHLHMKIHEKNRSTALQLDRAPLNAENYGAQRVKESGEALKNSARPSRQGREQPDSVVGPTLHQMPHTKGAEEKQRNEDNKESKFHPCSICSERFSSLTELARHIKMKHVREQAQSAETSPYTVEIMREVKGQAESTAKKYKCDECGKSYNLQGQLAMHLNHSHKRKHTSDDRDRPLKILKVESLNKAIKKVMLFPELTVPANESQAAPTADKSPAVPQGDVSVKSQAAPTADKSPAARQGDVSVKSQAAPTADKSPAAPQGDASVKSQAAPTADKSPVVPQGDVSIKSQVSPTADKGQAVPKGDVSVMKVYKSSKVDKAQTSLYRCWKCKEGFDCSEDFQVHKKSECALRDLEMPEEGNLTCKKCGKKLDNIKYLENHMKLHEKVPQTNHERRDLICETCGMLCKDIESLQAHSKRHNTKTITSVCEFCNRKFASPGFLFNHKERYHKGETLPANQTASAKSHPSKQGQEEVDGEGKQTDTSQNKNDSQTPEREKEKNFHNVSNRGPKAGDSMKTVRRKSSVARERETSVSTAENAKQVGGQSNLHRRDPRNDTIRNADKFAGDGMDTIQKESESNVPVDNETSEDTAANAKQLGEQSNTREDDAFVITVKVENENLESGDITVNDDHTGESVAIPDYDSEEETFGDLGSHGAMQSETADQDINVNQGYSCTICDLKCGTSRVLDLHMEKYHKKETRKSVRAPLNCPVCNKVCPNKTFMERHLRYHRQNKTHDPSIPKSADQIEQIEQLCEGCGKIFTSDLSLQSHYCKQEIGLPEGYWPLHQTIEEDESLSDNDSESDSHVVRCGQCKEGFDDYDELLCHIINSCEPGGVKMTSLIILRPIVHAESLS
ncbi:zinc finger protein 729-like isoform X2 [Ptychodera flava]|uniref:zinc finger protein 729-like isoform X2 n=1 Tax=Ptychodera flava TaxID=63121 RepID=UPI00396A477C